MNPGICIVLASHDGARFLSAQLDSLLAQSVGGFRLLVMDDHSSDDSAAILARYARRDPRMQLVERDAAAPSGALPSYAQLLQTAARSGADYVFCADQDDVWEAGKLAGMMQALQEAEGAARLPALVHHDLEVVDAGLLVVAGSFWEYMKLDPGTESRPQRLLSRNEVTGCAMACNRALLELALPIPPQAIMHDWWLALCAAYFGRLRPVRKRWVRYRQHGANAIGAKSFRQGLNPFTNWVAGWRRGDAEFLATVAQARAFCHAMHGRLDPQSAPARAIGLYASLPALSRWSRLRAMRQCAVWRAQWLLDAVLVLRLLLLPRAHPR